MIGRIERVKLREVWPLEAEFTTWLSENMDRLGEAIGLWLTDAEVEKAAGAFSADIVAQAQDGTRVVIENQLERSDHDHLGKLITYLTMLEAKAAVWIVADPKPDHVGAVTWLNESSSASFYLVKLEAVRIGDSDRAPILTLITGPSEEGRNVVGVKEELDAVSGVRQRFWTQLLAGARERTPRYATAQPCSFPWLQASAGVPGIMYSYVIRKRDCEVGVAIQRLDPDWNGRVFDSLLTCRTEIEGGFGEELLWDRAEAVTYSYVRHPMAVGGHQIEEKWPEVQEAMIDAMVRLERAFAPHIARLAV